MKRSRAYQKVFDPEHQLMNGKDSRGSYRRPFDPFFSSYDESDFIEGNSWQYSFFVPHDVNGLIELYGNADALVAKLDELFTLNTSNLESKPLDITGLIGEYAHGNEPSHHIAYLYTLAGYPEKAQYWLNRIMNDLYYNTPAGLCGNEDCGQMSAWYVFSALGFYPVNPADGRYILGVPILKEATIRAGSNKFTMEARNLSPENCFVKSVELNGKKLERNYIDHREIQQGGRLVFSMGKADYLFYPDKTSP
jgi:predicted alpha-1,2-mannosidase